MVPGADYQTNSVSPEATMEYTPNRTFSPESDIRRESLHRSARLAQLARAPDCRLETLGCGQPSGGPRFKSGSADQHVTIPEQR